MGMFMASCLLLFWNCPIRHLQSLDGEPSAGGGRTWIMRATAPSQMKKMMAQTQRWKKAWNRFLAALDHTTSYYIVLHLIPPYYIILHGITILVEWPRMGRIPHESVLAGPMLIQLIGSRGRPNRFEWRAWLNQIGEKETNSPRVVWLFSDLIQEFRPCQNHAKDQARTCLFIGTLGFCLQGLPDWQNQMTGSGMEGQGIWVKYHVTWNRIMKSMVASNDSLKMTQIFINLAMMIIQPNRMKVWDPEKSSVKWLFGRLRDRSVFFFTLANSRGSAWRRCVSQPRQVVQRSGHITQMVVCNSLYGFNYSYIRLYLYVHICIHTSVCCI